MILRRLRDVGLMAEEYDSRERRQLGNFPQAFSHVALVNTGLNLMKHEQAMARATGQPSHNGTEDAELKAAASPDGGAAASPVA